MSRNSKNATRKAQAKAITALHLKGEKGPSSTGGSKKKNAWWQKGDYKAFVTGGKKPRQEA
jgi:hypothetical protein